MGALLVVAVQWVPAQIRNLDGRLSRIEDIETRLAVLQDKLAGLEKLEKKLDEAASARAPLAHIDDLVTEITQKLNTVVVPAVNDLKDRAASKSDVDKIAAQVSQLSRDVEKKSPDVEKKVADVAAAVGELKDLIEATRKLVESTTRDIAKDVKQLHLELMKLQQKASN